MLKNTKESTKKNNILHIGLNKISVLIIWKINFITILANIKIIFGN